MRHPTSCWSGILLCLILFFAVIITIIVDEARRNWRCIFFTSRLLDVTSGRPCDQNWICRALSPATASPSRSNLHRAPNTHHRFATEKYERCKLWRRAFGVTKQRHYMTGRNLWFATHRPEKLINFACMELVMRRRKKVGRFTAVAVVETR